MKNKPYAVRGDKRQGHRIAVPESAGVWAGDEFDFAHCAVPAKMTLPAGSLVYVPHVDDNAGTGGSDRESTKQKVRK